MIAEKKRESKCRSIKQYPDARLLAIEQIKMQDAKICISE